MAMISRLSIPTFLEFSPPAYKRQKQDDGFVQETQHYADDILYLIECGETKYNEEIIHTLQQIDIQLFK